MKDATITKKQLIQELEIVRQLESQILEQLSELETQDTYRKPDFLIDEPAEIIYNVKPHVQHHEGEKFQFPEHPQLRAIFAFIEVNYYQPITLNDVAKAFSYTPSYLTSLVRRLTGKTLYQWIVQRRMFQARCLLLSTELPVCKIAEAVGYPDTGHFVKHFRQIHKKPPKSWKHFPSDS
ncbi:DNA-binding domain-containing protein, AraC-type [Rivularia sp. PCC 7116]|uniref:helix-turn-helix transcriptional regulator n=1 Tax=Rivularia sp. PCC 7116 TaxID=373994 RepID=UPI00029F38AE|nr:AraC family transcriptional regulator [Rivularia sp. PCC 7116]AFY57192.1 DNA-binding domain-containing protein, AraC-type [Rivularia sp. PCC 7116]